MLTDSIDSRRLIQDIHTSTLDCIHLKSVLRATWTKPMADEQRRLIRARRHVTELLVLLAASRRRLHVVHAPREVRSASPSFDPSTWDAKSYNLTIANRLLKDYALGVAASEAQAEAQVAS